MDSVTVSDAAIVADFNWRIAEGARAAIQVDRYRMRSMPARILRIGFPLALVAILLLAMGGAFLGPDPESHFWDLFPWGLLILLWLMLRLGGAGWLAAWRLRRTNPHLTAGSHHVISPAEYRVRCGAVDSSITWAGIVQLIETTEFFLTFPTRTTAYYLPKRALSEEQQTALRALAAERLGQRFRQLAA
jgi:YcxB-like protein